MSQKALIELAAPVPVQSITHYKICSWTIEVPRPSLEKEGYCDIWLAKCYLEDGIYYELELPGLNIRIEGLDFEELSETATTVKDLLTDSTEILSQFLVDHGYLEGVVILVNGA